MIETSKQLRELQSRFPVVVTLEVAWGDMDYFRHVNNTVFFRYFETARIGYLERIGFADEVTQSQIGPILHSTHCRFRLPLTYPDRVHVGARTSELHEDRFSMEYAVLSEQHSSLAAHGGGVVVSYDYAAGAKSPIPPAVRTAILRLQPELDRDGDGRPVTGGG